MDINQKENEKINDSKNCQTQKLAIDKKSSPRIKNQSTRYAYRALKHLTKPKDNFPFLESSIEILKTENLSTSESIESVKKSRKQKTEFIDYKNIREKLKTIAPKYLGVNFFPTKQNVEIKTIISTTRSNSGSSTKFQNKQFEEKSLTRIPLIKIYPRKNSDRCLPCLYKSFEKFSKFSQLISKSSEIDDDESSVTVPELEIRDFDNLIKDRELKIDDPIEEDKSEISQESILSKDHSLSPKSIDKKVSVKSPSAQSISDISKPSSPSGQSSESEDARADVSNEALDISKYLAPCHAPLVWKPSLESLKALRSRKAISMQSRITAIVSKSLDDSELEDDDDDDNPSSDVSTPKDSRKQNEKIKTVKIQSPKSKIESSLNISSNSKVKRKKLSRTKTTVGQIDISSITDEEKKSRFIRAKTSIDLISDQKNISFDDIVTLEENEMEKSFELTNNQQELLVLLEKCLNKQNSLGEILKILCNWYSIKNREIRKYDSDPDLKKALKISLNLLRLLAESKLYLNSNKFSPDLEFSQQQPFQCNSRQLRRVLPLKLYNKVATILNMPVWYPKNVTETEIDVSKDNNIIVNNEKSTSDLSTDLIVSKLLLFFLISPQTIEKI